MPEVHRHLSHQCIVDRILAADLERAYIIVLENAHEAALREAPELAFFDHPKQIEEALAVRHNQITAEINEQVADLKRNAEASDPQADHHQQYAEQAQNVAQRPARKLALSQLLASYTGTLSAEELKAIHETLVRRQAEQKLAEARRHMMFYDEMIDAAKKTQAYQELRDHTVGDFYDHLDEQYAYWEAQEKAWATKLEELNVPC